MSRARRSLREFICYLSGGGYGRTITGSAGVALDDGGLWFSVSVPTAPLGSAWLVRGGPEARQLVPIFTETRGLPTTSIAVWRSSPEVTSVTDDLECGRAVWVEVVAGQQMLTGKLRPVIGAAREQSAR
jgi:hypothetical protein